MFVLLWSADWIRNENKKTAKALLMNMRRIYCKTSTIIWLVQCLHPPCCFCLKFWLSPWVRKKNRIIRNILICVIGVLQHDSRGYLFCELADCMELEFFRLTCTCLFFRITTQSSRSGDARWITQHKNRVAGSEKQRKAMDVVVCGINRKAR